MADETLDYPSLHYRVCDVFTSQPFGGNPLAVVFDADGLDGQQMQRIAAEFNLSETVFVLPPSPDAQGDADLRFRIFTPAAELPFAGHPTIGGALCARAQIGFDADALRIEERAGIVDVVVESDASDASEAAGALGRARLRAAQPLQLGDSPCTKAQVARLIGLEADAIVEAPFVASAGTPFLFVELRDRECLARARFDMGVWEALERAPLTGRVYCFAGSKAPGSTLESRLFAPELGIAEDPATGSAAVTLAGWLAEQLHSDGVHDWALEQGRHVGRPSQLALRAEWSEGRATVLEVGGGAVEVARGRMRVPSPA